MRSRTRSKPWALVVLALFFCTVSIAVRADVTLVTLASPGTYGEDDDYFTTVWGNPRDMNDPDDLYVINSSCAPAVQPRWTDLSFGDGVWRGTTGSDGQNGWVSVLNPGWYSSLDIGEDGQLRPIDTGHYTQLTFRMRVANGAGISVPRVEWDDGPIGEPGGGARGMQGFRVNGDGLWHVYSLNLGSNPNWTSGPVFWLWFQFEPVPSGHRIELDWVRLTPRQTRQVRWQGDALYGSASVYLGPNAAHPEQYGDLRLYGAGETPVQIDASARMLAVPASFPDGEYYARVEVGGIGASSSHSWRFLPLPVVEITAPSYTSGEDWAAAVLGNPWDMSGLDDVDMDGERIKKAGIQSMKVSDGVLTVVSKDDGLSDCGEPWPHRALDLNLGGQYIDPTKYKYFSYRYKVDNAPDQGAGGVTRVRWQAQHLPYWPTGRTDDLSLYNNDWHTYSLDLETVQLEGEMGQWKDIPADVMEIMLHESHRQWTSYLDWVKLTAENEAHGSYLVRWNVVQAGAPLTTTLYWAKKEGAAFRLVPGSGEVVSAPSKPGGTVPSGHVLYLPFVVGNYGGGSKTVQHAKSTQGLAVGQVYYVAIKLEDGYNESMWYSAVPVRVR